MLVGITGMPECGKTTFCRMFRTLGSSVIDADRIGHDLLVDPGVMAQLLSAFGSEISHEGCISRPALADLVLHDPQSLKILNAIIHPPLLKQMATQVREAYELHRTSPVIVDAALLTEWNIHAYFDLMIFLWRSTALRYASFSSEHGDVWKIERLERAQDSESSKRSHCHLIIENNGTLDDLELRAKVLYRIISRDPQHMRRGKMECRRKLWID